MYPVAIMIGGWQALIAQMVPCMGARQPGGQLSLAVEVGLQLFPASQLEHEPSVFSRRRLPEGGCKRDPRTGSNRNVCRNVVVVIVVVPEPLEAVLTLAMDGAIDNSWASTCRKRCHRLNNEWDL